MTKQDILDEFRHMGAEDKLALIDELWSEAVAQAEARPLGDDERQFLDQRLREVEADPRPDRDWAQVRRDLLGR